MQNKYASTILSDRITSRVRKASLQSISDSVQDTSFKKVAFDTRKIKQDRDRNPRKNLQFWHRSQQFISAETNRRMTALSRLMVPMSNINEDYQDQPEYLHSYAKSLYDIINRLFNIKQANLEIYTPQLDYLEQILYTRYRLSMEDVAKMSSDDIEARILSRDEALLKRGMYLYSTDQIKSGQVNNEALVVESVSEQNHRSDFQRDNYKKQDNYKPRTEINQAKRSENNSKLELSKISDGINKQILKDGESSSQEGFVNLIHAIFGDKNLRRENEKKAERTITITIRDEAS